MKWSIIMACTLIATPVGAKTEVLFSPHGGCQQAVVQLIERSKSTLDIAVYSIGNDPIVAALLGARARGIRIRVLTDHTQAAVNLRITRLLVESRIDLRLHTVGKIMHNKFVVSDGKTVETGSFNWTNPAEAVNEENCVLLDDASAVASFHKRFENHLWEVNTALQSEKHLEHLWPHLPPISKPESNTTSTIRKIIDESA